MTRLLTPLPGWARLVIGTALIAGGAVLLGKPFDTLELLVPSLGMGAIAAGLGTLIATRGRGVSITAPAIVAVLAGGVCLIFSDELVEVLPIITAAAMLVAGGRRLRTFVGGRSASRVAMLASGVAWTGFGIAALLWRDLTQVLIGLLIAPIAILAGLRLLLSLRSRRQYGDAAPRRPARLSAWLRTGTAVLSAVLALAILAGTVSLYRSVPRIDAFYDPPDTIPQSPGQLLKQETFTRDLPENARAIRILYTTPEIDGVTMGVGSAIVYLPEAPATTPIPVILWTHGTTGVAQECAPSLADDPLGSGAMPARQQVIDNGWAIVMPDYIGLGTAAPHPYLVGIPAARSSLDALRAAHQLSDGNLAPDTIVWGHSQGGGTALWTGIESLTYAPELTLLGVAAMAPASDLSSLADPLTSTTFGRVFGTFLVHGYSAYYDDVAFDDYFRPAALVPYEAMTKRCLSSQATLASVAVALADDDVFEQSVGSGPLAERMAENVPRTVTGIPTFIGQGASDQLILPAVQEAYVRAYCDDEQVIEYISYAGRTHLSVVDDDSALIPDLLAWTTARFTGEPAATSCSFTAK